MAFRPFLLAAAVMPLSLVACGGDDGGTIIPEGPHYHYVANQAFIPTTANQAREWGLDLDDNGQVDNQLGMVLSVLASQGGFDLQSTVDAAVAEGDIILLVDVQTSDFSSTAAAGIQVFLGENPTPAACMAGETYDEMNKTGCGHHLDGSGMFSIAASSPDNAALGGKIVGGKFTGGPGNLSLQIALGGPQPIKLDLIGARAEASGLSDAMIGSGTTGGVIFGGAVTKADIDNEILPAIHAQLEPIIAEDCTMPTMPPGCGCEADSTGKTILSFFDTDKNCSVTLEEIQNHSLIVSLLAPDVTIDGQQALSIGLKATAVKATYTVPGQM